MPRPGAVDALPEFGIRQAFNRIDNGDFVRRLCNGGIEVMTDGGVWPIAFGMVLRHDMLGE
jgi:hypothetical protein